MYLFQGLNHQMKFEVIILFKKALYYEVLVSWHINKASNLATPKTSEPSQNRMSIGLKNENLFYYVNLTTCMYNFEKIL